MSYVETMRLLLKYLRKVAHGIKKTDLDSDDPPALSRDARSFS